MRKELGILKPVSCENFHTEEHDVAHQHWDYLLKFYVIFILFQSTAFLTHSFLSQIPVFKTTFHFSLSLEKKKKKKGKQSHQFVCIVLVGFV